MAGRLASEEYLRLNEEYRNRLFELMKTYSQKKFQVLGIAPSTVSSWRNRDKSVPDVIVGAAVARELGKTVEEMVYGERNNYYRSKIIESIVELLDPYADHEVFLNQIYGLVKSYIQNNAPSEEKRAASNG